MVVFLLLRTVWIYPYFDVSFPDSYENLWCGFSNDQIFAIKNALRGSLLLGLHKGLGVNFGTFLEKFPTYAREITPSASKHCQNVQFIHTTYVLDCVIIAASVLNTVVESKSRETNTPISDIEITQADHNLLVNELQQKAIKRGVTGPLGFDDEGNRRVRLFAIMNFVPVDNSNFSVKNAVAENPWSLQIRGVLKEEDGNVSIVFLKSDGRKSNKSTIIFPDGTTNIPPDHPFHISYRSE